MPAGDDARRAASEPPAIRTPATGSPFGPAAAYAAIVFGAGFVLGAVRVLLVVPRIGTRAAELLEVPLMIVISFVAAGWICRRLGSDATAARALAVGALALLFLLIAEVLTGIALRGTSARDALVNPDPVSGPLYYLSLALFALWPALRGMRRRASRDR